MNSLILALIFMAQITAPAPVPSGPYSTVTKAADIAKWYSANPVQEGNVTVNGTPAKVTRKPYGSCPMTYELSITNECFIVRIGEGKQGDRPCDAFVIERHFGGVCQ
jgi:hypothetical protein